MVVRADGGLRRGSVGNDIESVGVPKGVAQDEPMVSGSIDLEAVTEPVQLSASNLDLSCQWRDKTENVHCSHRGCHSPGSFHR